MLKKKSNRCCALVVVLAMLLCCIGSISVSANEDLFNPSVGFNNDPSNQFYNLIEHDRLQGRSERSTYITSTDTDPVLGSVVTATTNQGNGNQASIADYGTFAIVNNYNYVTIMYKYSGSDNIVWMGETYTDNQAEWVTSTTYGDGEWHTLVFDFTDIHKAHSNAYAKAFTIEYGKNGEALSAQFANWRLYDHNPFINSVSIDNIKPIAGGVSYSTTDVPQGANYIVKNIEWTESNGGAVSEFEIGKSYTATVTLKANAGYLFVADGTYSIGDNTTFLDISSDVMGNEVTLKKTFGALEEPEEIEDLFNPSVGFNNDPSNQFYNLIEHDRLQGRSERSTYITSTDTDPVLGSVVTATTNQGNGNQASIADYGTFAIVNNYNYVTIMYKYSGSDNIVWMGETYTDNQAEWVTSTTYGDGEWHTLVFDFTDIHKAHSNAYAKAFTIEYGKNGEALSAQFANWRLYDHNPFINSVSIDNIKPIAGGVSYSTTDVPQGANYIVKNIEWTESNGGAVSEFEIGKSYTATVTLKANAGYLFAADGTYSIGDNTTFLDISSDVMGNEIKLQKTFDEITLDRLTNLVENGDMEQPSDSIHKFHTDATGIVTKYDTDASGNKYLTLDASNNEETWAVAALSVDCNLTKGQTYYYTLKAKVSKDSTDKANVDGSAMYIAFGDSGDSASFWMEDEFIKQTGIYTASQNISSIWMLPKFSNIAEYESTSVYSIDDFEIYNITDAKKITYSSRGCGITVEGDNIVIDDMSRTIYADEGTVLTFTADPISIEGKTFVCSDGVQSIGDNKFTYIVGSNDSDVKIEYVDNITYAVDGEKLVVSAIDSGNRCVIVANYNTDESLKEVWSGDATTSSLNGEVTLSPNVELNGAKILCWNSMLDIKPLRREAKIMPKANVFLVGDSSCYDNSERSKVQGWGYYFKNMISNANVINESAWDATVTEFLESDRYKDMKSKWNNGDYMVVSLGIYDCKNTTAIAFSDALTRLVNEAKAEGVNVILVKEQETIGRRTEEFTTILNAVGSVGEALNVPVVDLYSVTGNLTLAERAGDYKSLTDAGAQCIAEKLYTLIMNTDTDLKYYLK